MTPNQARKNNFAMHFQPLLAGLALLGVANAGFYSKSSPVLQVDAKNYERLIAKSNHTSVRPTTSLSPLDPQPCSRPH